MTRSEHKSQPLTLLAKSDVYCCGPQGLMSDIETLSKDAGANFYQEHFSLAPIVNDDSATEIDVTVTLNGNAFTASNQQNLLIQLESQNAPVIRGCGIGVCHQCHCTKKSGLVKNLLTGDVSDSGEQIIQLCISQPLSDLEMSI
jgi:ferredoxin